MPGFNLKTYQEEFISQATLREVNRSSTPFASDTDISRRLYEALVFFDGKFRPTRRRTTANLQEAQQLVRMPFNRINAAITDVYVVRPDGQEIPLQRVDDRVMENQLGFRIDDVSKDQGLPAYWSIAHTDPTSQAERDSIRIRPVSDWSMVDGVIFRFPQMTTQLTRVINTDSKAATFVKNSTFVYLSGVAGGTPDADIRPGDEIGYCDPLNFDGSTIADPTVREWYGVLDVTRPSGDLSDLITNGTFNSDLSGWLATNVSHATDVARFDNSGGEATLEQVISSAIPDGDPEGFFLTFEIKATTGFGPTDVFTVEWDGVEVSPAGGYTKPGTYCLGFDGVFLGGDILFKLAAGGGSATLDLDNVVLTRSAKITLDRPYDQEDVCEGRFISAQVPDLEYSIPGGIGFAAVHWALATFYDGNNNTGKATYYRNLAIERLGLLDQSEVEDDQWPLPFFDRIPTYTTTSWLRGNSSQDVPIPFPIPGWEQPKP